MRKVLLLACLVITISAYAPARSETATAVPATATLLPTSTPTLAPSLTPSPAFTPTITPTPSPEDEAWLARITSALHGLRKKDTGPSELWGLRDRASISPDGHWLASVVSNGDPFQKGGDWMVAGDIVVTSLTGPEKVFREHLASVPETSLIGAWSPDSTRFMFFWSSSPGDRTCPGSPGYLVTIQATGLISFPTDLGVLSCSWVIWSPDGQSMLFIASMWSGGQLWLMDASSGVISMKAQWALGSPVAMPLAWTQDGFYYEACVDGNVGDCNTAKLMQMDTTTWSVRAVRDLPGYVSAVSPGVFDLNSNTVFVISNKYVIVNGDFTAPPHRITRLSLDPGQADTGAELPHGRLTGESAVSTNPGTHAAVIVDAQLWLFNSTDGSLTAHGPAYDVIGWFSNIAGFLVIAPQQGGQGSPPELRIVRP